MVRGEAASPEPYQTVSTVYFILGILRTDPWSQGQWREKKWRKVPCPRKQRDGRSLNPGVWGVSPSVTHASTGITEISISGFIYSGSRNGKIYLNNYWMKFLWYPIIVFLYNVTVTRNTHPVWHCPQKSCACNLQISQLSVCRKLANRSRRLRWFPKLTLESLANEKTDNEYNLR